MAPLYTSETVCSGGWMISWLYLWLWEVDKHHNTRVCIVATSFLTGFWCRFEEASWWGGKLCACTTECFLPFPKTSTVTETVSVLPTELMFLKEVYSCLAVLRWTYQWTCHAVCNYVVLWGSASKSSYHYHNSSSNHHMQNWLSIKYETWYGG